MNQLNTRRQAMATLLAVSLSGPALAQQGPRRPGNGVPVSRPNSQGVTQTWSQLPQDELVQALKAGGYARARGHRQESACVVLLKKSIQSRIKP
jgi:hypothetical protein